MGLVLTPSGTARAASPLRIASPVAGPLLLWARFGGTLAASLRNLADIGLPSMVATGTPTILSDRATIDASNFPDTGIPEFADMTQISLERSDASQATSGTRHVSGITGNGFTMLSGGPALHRANALFNVSGTPTLRQANLTIPDQTSWRWKAAVVQQGVGVTIYDLTAGTKATAAETAARSLAPTTTMRIGAGPTMQCAAFIVFGSAAGGGGALTESQLQQIRAFEGAALGISA